AASRARPGSASEARSELRTASARRAAVTKTQWIEEADVGARARHASHSSDPGHSRPGLLPAPAPPHIDAGMRTLPPRMLGTALASSLAVQAAQGNENAPVGTTENSGHGFVTGVDT